MSADAAAAKLIEMIHSRKVDDRTKLMAVKDLLDRANVSGTQNIQIGVEQPRTFEQWIGDALVDFDGPDDDLPREITATRTDDIVDAEVVDEGDPEWWPPTKRDAAFQRQVEEARRRASKIERQEDVPAPPVRDKFGVVRDDSEERAARDRHAAAIKRADKTLRTSGGSTADPYADRYPGRGRRTVSPRRYEQRNPQRPE